MKYNTMYICEGRTLIAKQFSDLEEAVQLAKELINSPQKYESWVVNVIEKRKK